MRIPVRGQSFGPGQVTFGESMLKAESSGSSRQHLSVIEIFRIQRASIDCLTTNQNMTLVQPMVKQYIKSSRTNVLAIYLAAEATAMQKTLSNRIQVMHSFAHGLLTALCSESHVQSTLWTLMTEEL